MFSAKSKIAQKHELISIRGNNSSSKPAIPFDPTYSTFLTARSPRTWWPSGTRASGGGSTRSTWPSSG